MDSAVPMLQAALWYAELGYAVFPCAPGRKTPLTEHGLLDATTDRERIREWWTENPAANLALRTDGLMVIDDDRPDPPWLTDQPEKLNDLAQAPTSLTPRGGRQYFFRQPEGRAWRNTAGRLAESVDTRATGGYVLVAPSVVDGRSYRWLDEHELSVSLERLPEPPAWLIEQLDAMNAFGTAVSDPPSANAIPAGQRNDTLARLAGVMRRVGMSQTEILAALRQVNANRCTPPLPLPEFERIAGSIARYEPNSVSVALAEDHWRQDSQESPTPITSQELLRTCRTLRAPLVHGVLRRGETMNVIAPPKCGKSWLVLALAMAVATGRRWLNTFDTVAGNVLIIDNELHKQTIAHRIPQVAEASRIGLDQIGQTLSVQSLRGQLRDIFSMRPYFDSLEQGRFSLIVLDAFYRFMPRDMDENDNGTMANIYNHLDALADRLDCSFVLIHHATKGNQSGKAVTDVGAGAGSQSRAADTHLVMRPHEERGAVVLEAAVRSWPPIEPIALRWTFPVWTPAIDLDPSRLRRDKPKRNTSSDAPSELDASSAWTAEQFIETFLSDQPMTKGQIRDAATGQAGLSWRRVSDLLEIAESRGLIHRWHEGRSHRAVYATVPLTSDAEVSS